MTTLQIVESHLRANGFDGLYYHDCGCSVDDLAPCGNMQENCRAAARYRCLKCLKPFYAAPDYKGRCAECIDCEAEGKGE